MKIKFTAYGNIQTATADDITTYEYEAGATADVADDIAALFVSTGVAEPVKTARASKTADDSDK